jgi:hypothetical protein
MRRRAAAAPLVVAVTALALLLGGCGNGGQALAQQACTHVNRSLALYAEVQRHPHAPGAAGERRQATAQLQTALPLAARANSSNPQFNPLMTTLEDAGSNSEGKLVSALRVQCEAADHPGSTGTVPG